MLRGIEWKGSHLLYKGQHEHDDAVVVRMPDGRLMCSTVDVFTPVVDDPYLYGQVAAANSLSDIYAMGGVPRFALSILGYPPDRFRPHTPSRIIQGAIDKAWEAGVVLGGGHTIKSTDVIFGLAVVGDFPDGNVLEKGGAAAGDLLAITKPLGIGVLTTAIKRQKLSAEETDEVVGQMVTLNNTASRIAAKTGAKSCTDVTGFGMLGHLSEMVQASEVAVRIFADRVPFLDRAYELAVEGVIPGGSRDNLKFVEPVTRFADTISQEMKLLLADAQTSGGLLVAVPPSQRQNFLELCRQQEQFAAFIGHFEAGEPLIIVA